MFSHIMIGANDIKESKTFYDAIFGALGIPPGFDDQNGHCMYKTETNTFILTIPINGEKASHGNGMTIGFAAKTPEEIDAWHAAGIANGGVTCEDPPGVRDGEFGKLYLAYLRDPAGNKLCAALFMS